ncbi:MAG: hypothetical protein H7330_11875 [Hymenobacteraceae bacterium]|nr:hypothetical protein [Hymenobacteraceae bacterium]
MEQWQLNVLRMSRGELAHFDGAPALWDQKPVLVTVLNTVRALTNGIVQAGLTQQELITTGYTLDKDQQLTLMGAVTEPLVRGLRPLARMTNDNVLLKQVDFAPSELVRGPEQESVNRAQLIHDAAATRVADLANYGVTPAMISAQQVAIDTFKPLAGLRDAVGGKRQTATATLPELFTQLRTQFELLDDLTENLVDGATFKATYRELRAIIDTRGGRGDGGTNDATPPVG